MLVDRVIGHAPESDPSVGPGLLTRPFDRVVEGLRLVNAPDSESARALARAGPVDADESVTTRNPSDSVEALVVLVLVSVRVAQEVTLLHLLVVLGVLLAAPGMVDEGPPVYATVHDHRDGLIGVRPEDIGEHERAIPERDLEVAVAADAEDVAADLIARRGRRHEGARRPVTEDLRPVQVLEQPRDGRVVSEGLDGIRRSARQRHGPVAEVDPAIAHHLMDLGSQVDPVVGVAVLVEGLKKARDVGQAGVGQLVHLTIDPGDDVADREPVRAQRRPEGNRTDREGDDLAIHELERPIVVGEARAARRFELEAGHRSGEPSLTQHGTSSQPSDLGIGARKGS